MKTTFLMALLTVLFIAVGNAIAGVHGMKIAFVMAVCMNFFSYWFSDKMVLRSYNAKEVTQAEAPQLYSIVRNLATRGQIPMPKVYIVQNPTPNAFATGRNPHHAAVAVTTGILQLLSNEELSGVIGHELTHVRNRDILTGSIAATFAGAISMLRWAAMIGGSRDDNRRGNPMAMLLALIFAPMAAMLIQMAISRSREFAADKGGAELCGDPMFLASALNKLERGNQMATMDASPASAHMFIVNPLARLGGITALFRTHPLTEERIKRLEQMRGQRFAA